MDKNTVSEHQARVNEICASRAEDLQMLDSLLELAESGDLDTWREIVDLMGVSNADVSRVARFVLEDAGIDVDADADASELLDAWMNSDVLDIQVHGRRFHARGEWEITSLVFVLTVGGPHVEFTTTGGDDVELFVSWSPEKASGRVHVPTLAGHLESLADALAE